MIDLMKIASESLALSLAATGLAAVQAGLGLPTAMDAASAVDDAIEDLDIN